MFDVIFLILLCLYFFVAMKLEEWLIISKLGFISSTPQGFIEHPNIYRIIRSTLFYTSALSLFGATNIPWYIGVAILLCASLSAAYIGRNSAFKAYRANHQYLLNSTKHSNESPYTHEELLVLKEGANISNFELRKKLIKGY